MIGGFVCSVFYTNMSQIKNISCLKGGTSVINLTACSRKTDSFIVKCNLCSVYLQATTDGVQHTHIYINPPSAINGPSVLRTCTPWFSGVEKMYHSACCNPPPQPTFKSSGGNRDSSIPALLLLSVITRRLGDVSSPTSLSLSLQHPPSFTPWDRAKSFYDCLFSLQLSVCYFSPGV